MTPAHVRLRIENTTDGVWKAADGYAGSYQVYDRETDTLVFEGPRTPLGRDLEPGDSIEMELDVEFPPEPGSYRAFVSGMCEHAGWFYENGTDFIVVDAGDFPEPEIRTTTMAALRRRRLLRSFRRAFEYPVRSAWQNRNLIRSMVRRDIAGRYRGSFAGMFWTLLNPLVLMATYYFVFGIVLRARFGNDPSRAGFVLYFLCGMLPWLAFSEAAGRAPFIILEYRNFVKKLIFPIETLPVNIALAGLVTEVFALGVFVAFLLFARGAVPFTVLWLPLLVIPQLLFTMGIVWFLSALGVYLRDLGQIIGFLLTLWFFLTPICYSVESLPQEALAILAKNPMFVLVGAYRAIFLESRAPAAAPLAQFWIISTLLFFAGHAWFHKLRKSFADVI